MRKNLRLGKNPFQTNSDPVRGEQVRIEGESFYLIANYDRMRPFFMSIVSSSDHWMFISSNGALTAGRRNPDHALFPYYTDDKIHDSAEITGSKTVFIVQKPGDQCLWEPFTMRQDGIYRIQRNLYKSFWGNKLIFEEINQDLGLTFRYGWFNSDRFGLVKKAWLSNSGAATSRTRLLDGLQNLVPCGVGSQLQLEKSTLVDAYKKNELLPGTGLGLFMLSSIIVDRPEPAESLKATTVWSVGLGGSLKLLSSVQLDGFRHGKALKEETDIRAERGAYFVHAEVTLKPGQVKDWMIVGDVDRGAVEVAGLNHLLRRPAQLRRMVEQDIEQGTQELRRIVAGADGLQKSAHPLGNARHFGNVLFNVMRGGIFHEGYQVDPADLKKFVQHANKDVATRNAGYFRKFAKGVSHSCVVAIARETGDADLERLCREYLPLTFSRRHGDPSRPWNRFSIPARNPDGSRILNYEGNWRDIFQNWEALAVSFPNYVAGMICKFVNASTADGYNPYRVSRDGIDWEVIDPADPWSHIGYWGDHQIIYLLKLLEVLEGHDPATLRDFLTRDIFSYANVPYRIKSYEHLLKNSKETVEFDQALEDKIHERVKLRGSDGKLRWDRKQQVQLVNLGEKLIVSVLAKLSNFVPEAGIWLNTQRPEWNDANNALVGNGVSMVTLYYLRRYLSFCLEIFGSLERTESLLSEEVGRFLQEVCRILERHQQLMTRAISDKDRMGVLEDLGRAGSRYREQIYGSGFSGRKMQFKGKQVLGFFSAALDWIDHSIKANRRKDGLYHAYNLITLDQKKGIRIRQLYEMLEGQVAALSSGSLSAEESLQVLTALRQSAMYRADQNSYLLYPDRQLPRFSEKNAIPRKAVGRSRLVQKLVSDGNRLLVERDTAGVCHFNGALCNARDVGVALERLAAGGYASLVKTETVLVQEIFEKLFDHQSFTGRSGTFFGYEGLGSIYWHMVSKLLLAAQETFFRALDAGAAAPTLKQLAKCYYEIRAGIGDHKTPREYGAFPMDPYSHTPAHTGARQPGLTGQVKEDILCRMGELGVFVRAGKVFFRPALLQRKEFLTEAGPFEYFDVAGLEKRIALKQHSLAFTYCQVPIVYRIASKRSVMVSFADGSMTRSDDLCLDSGVSRLIFDRSGKVVRILVSLNLSH